MVERDPFSRLYSRAFYAYQTSSNSGAFRGDTHHGPRDRNQYSSVAYHAHQTGNVNRGALRGVIRQQQRATRGGVVDDPATVSHCNNIRLTFVILQE